jgi:crotonobetainyl-CoA:carnitine CoA-transferase CaiB-like acyl-CoA transferase
VTDQALEHFVILDFSLDISGMYCTRLLADLGATVVQIEPPKGHPLRRRGPCSNDPDRFETNSSFLYFAANKKSIALDLGEPTDRKRALEIAGGSDLVVETFRPGHLEDLGLGYDVLKAANPSVILTSVTGFGQTGPYRNWQGDAIVDSALGGYMYLGGNAEKEPLMLPGSQSRLHAGVQAAYASLAAIWWARRTGVSQHIDVSAMEAMLSAHAWTSTSWTHEGVVMKRGEPDCIPCADGWVYFMMLRWDPNIFILVGRPELMDDPRFADRQSWIDHMDDLRAILVEWCETRGKEEIFRSGQELLIAVTPVNDIDDLLKSPQLTDRNWFQKIDHPVYGNCVLPGFPFHPGRTPASIRSVAPLPGQDQQFNPEPKPDPVLEFPARAPLEPGALSDTKLPLTGIRVLEITANWAGPLAARHMADLGAEVIKIEPTDRLLTRGGIYAGTQPFRHHYNRSPYFNKMNRNKYGITLNLADPRGKGLLMRLVEKSDVVIENNSPRVLRNLDIEYPVLKQANPGIVMASISGFGHTGPDTDYVAYGANIEASCGLASLTGYSDDDRPYRSSLFYADPVSGGHAAVAILAALFYKSRTGLGQYIDMSLQENGIVFFCEAVMERLVTGCTPERQGNRHPCHAPRGCYPSAGDDMWMVLCVRTDNEWRKFCEIIGRPHMATDRRYLKAEDRKAHHDELDEIIASWSSTFDHNEAAGLLQAAGIPAAPVLANWELTSNLHLYERGFYLPVAHREMGVFPYPGMPWKLSDTPGRVRRASPCWGEHNSLVFEGLLGLSSKALGELYGDRVIADHVADDIPGPFRFFSD